MDLRTSIDNWQGFRGLLSILGEHASDKPNACAYTFLMDGETESSHLSYAQLNDQVGTFATKLRKHLPMGERAMILLPASPEFITAFLACLAAGIVAVPAFAPHMRRGFREKLAKMLRDSGARLILLRTLDLAEVRTWLAALDLNNEIQLVVIDQEGTETADEAEIHCERDIQADTLAFLQYTSGSTGDPKGVMVSHGNIYDNEQKIAAAFGQNADSVIVGWLPFHHDMGLIGNILQPLFLGARAILMPPMAMLSKPLRWLKAIEKYKATTSGGPNFAYDLCVDRISEDEKYGLDLSSWKVAFNGAEPVRARSLRRFAEYFKPQGFDQAAFLPCYGLAESTLLVSGGPSDSGAHIQGVAADPLRAGRIVPDNGPNHIPLVGSGMIATNQKLCVVDGDGSAREDNHIGEIWIKGPSVAGGYWQRPNHEDFSGVAGDEEGWFKTGDLGFLREGRLFITGRCKELIIVNGQNHYPQDIEHTVQESHGDLAPGAGAAFTMEQEGESRLVVVQEVRRTALRHLDFPAVSSTVRAAVSQVHNLNLYSLVLIRPASLPKTTSGKIQRGQCLNQLKAGRLKTVLQQSWEVRMDGDTTLPSIDARELACLPRPRQIEQLRHYLKQLLAHTLSITPEEIQDHQSLNVLGIDSMAAITLQHRLAQDVHLPLGMAQILAGPTLTECIELLLPHLGTETRKEPRAFGPKSRAPLSANQHALWLIHQRDPHNTAYVLNLPLRIRGSLEVDRLKKALQHLVNHHESLRTVYGEEANEPYQEILERMLLAPLMVDAEDYDESMLEQALANATTQPIDLSKGVVDCTLFQLDTQHHVLLTRVHHIATDLWSLFILLEELGACYSNKEITAGAYRYTDFVRFQAARNDQQDLVWWHRQLAHLEEVSPLPFDHQTPSGFADSVRFKLDAADGIRLIQLARARRTTLFALLTAAWTALLHRYSDRHDLTIGTPFSGREEQAFQDVVGYFVNPVVIRTRLTETTTFAGFLQTVNQTILDAFVHGNAPFARVVETVGSKHPSHPLYQVMFTYQKPQRLQRAMGLILGEAGAAFQLGGLNVAPMTIDPSAVMFPLAATVVNHEGVIAGRLDYDTGLFSRGTLELLGKCFTHLLRILPEEIDLPISHLQPWAHKDVLLLELNRLSAAHSPQTIHEIIEYQAAQHPDKLAVVDSAGNGLGYGRMATAVQHLADRLAARGVKVGDLVGVCMTRDQHLPVALLAVLKLGAAYVPLDPNYPQTRLNHIIEDARPTLVVAPSSIAKNFAYPCLDPEQREHSVPTRRPTAADPSAIAYVIYTSGSSGEPKGVAVTHGNAAALLQWAAAVFTEAERRMVTASTSVCFDLSVFELFLPLRHGHTVAMVANLLTLEQAPFADQVTLINTVPSALSALLQQGYAFTSVTTVNVAGEPLSRDLVSRMKAKKRVRMLNLYGPSEDTTYSTFATVKEDDLKPPIGLPIDGSAAYILGHNLQSVPPGMVGELYLGGQGVSMGYLGRTGQTAARFLPDPFVTATPGARMYRTGDQVRLGGDGRLLFLGRVDQQVKIRGFRVELGEIEAQLMQLPQVAEAVVIGKDGPRGEQMLAAYIVPKEGRTLEVEELRQSIAEVLPHYLIPNHWIPMAAIPLTPNGKLDRKALPEPYKTPADNIVAPRTPLEQKLCALWSRELDIHPVGIKQAFFALGGHSLSAARIVVGIRDELAMECTLRTLFEAGTIAALARVLEIRQSSVATEPVPVMGDARRHAGHAQRRLWFLEQMADMKGTYHMAAAFNLHGNLNTDALVEALNRLVERHEILRTAFASEDGQPTLTVRDQAFVSLESLDAAEVSDPRAWLQEAVAKPFDLTQAPLIRSALLHRAPEEATWLLCVHHLLADGLSVAIMLRELSVDYAAICQGSTAPISPPQLHYADFAAWQERMAADGFFKKDVETHRALLGKELPLLNLPLDFPRPPIKSYTGGEVPFTIPNQLAQQLIVVARHLQCSPFVFMQTVFRLLLARYSGQDDLVLGTPVENRNHGSLKEVVGLLVNTVAVRTSKSFAQGFRDWVGNEQKAVIAALDAATAPFDLVVDAVQPERGLSHTPIFQAMFVWEAPLDQLNLAGVSVENLYLHNGGAKFDITLTITPRDQGFRGRFEYDTALFAEATAKQWARHFQNLLYQVLRYPDVPVQQLSMLTTEERRELMQPTEATVPLPYGGLYGPIARQALKHPQNEALNDGRKELTYAQLEQAVARLAAQLQVHGAAPGCRVGICQKRDVDLIICILAVLRTGAAYVPLDPAYPEERLKFMMVDSDVAIVVADNPHQAVPPRCTLLGAGDQNNGDAAFNPIELQVEFEAYVIYTSGTTGQPKGVSITHGNAAAMLTWASRVYNSEILKGSLTCTSVCFDLSIFEIFLPLWQGGTLLIAERLDQLTTHIDRVTLINTVPSAMDALLQRNLPMPALRVVNLAGEPLSRDLVDRIYRQSQVQAVYNLYGPSEDTTYSTAALVPKSNNGPPTIGRPIDGTRAYVLNPRGELQPHGVIGELFLGGAGISRGYQKRPGQTAERYLPDHLSTQAGGRLYRTGDLVNLRRDGELIFLGRNDDQVKIRGFRIELGEIENAFKGIDLVADSAVLIRNFGDDTRMVAFIVSASGVTLDEDQLKSELANALPAYMIPTHFVPLDQLPLTPNGKVDRKKLAATALTERRGTLVAPRNELEREILGLWAELLGVEVHGVTDNFFKLGGHSLMLTRMLARLQLRYGVEISPRLVFETPTIAALAEAVSSTEKRQRPRPVPVPRQSTHPCSFSQQRTWFAHQMGQGVSYHIVAAFKVEGDLNFKALNAALGAVANRHEILRTVFQAVDGEPRQVVGGASQPKLETRAFETNGPAHIADLVKEPFDLAKGPLIRLIVLTGKGGECYLLLNHHHIVSDGWSVDLLMGELQHYYKAFCEGPTAAPMAPLHLQYVDYAHWQHQRMASDQARASLHYWRQQLSGAPRTLALPYDHPHDQVQTGAGGTLSFAWSKSMLDQVNRMGAEHGYTLNMVLTTMWSLLISRLSGSEDLVVGTPIANRDDAALEPLIGYFANTLPLRIDLSGNPTTLELLERVQATTAQAFAHRETPYEKLVETREGDRGREGLFQTAFALWQTEGRQHTLGSLKLTPVPCDTGTAKFDLTLFLETSATGLKGFLEYADTFSKRTIQRMVEQLENLLEEMARAPQLPIGGLLADQRPIWQSLHAGSHQTVSFDHSALIHERISNMAERTPDSPAVIAGDVVLSFKQLDEAANGVAQRLAAAGVGPNVPVCLYFDRSHHAMVSLLAVLKAGGCYVPLTPEYPTQRIGTMLRESGLQLVLTLEDLAKTLPDGPWDVWDVEPIPATAHGPLVKVHGMHSAYTIFTSGSLGRPRGVKVTHEALLNLFHALHTRIYEKSREGRRVALNGPLSFDTSVKQWTRLAAGDCLVMVPGSLRLEPAKLLHYLHEHQVDVLDATPSHIRLLIDAGLLSPGGPEYLLIGGEAVLSDLWDTLAQAVGVKAYNMYGPTECTGDTTLALIANAGTIPSIGGPIANVTTWVLDEQLNPVSDLVAGQLCIGGAGLARGYVFQARETAARFVPNPFALKDSRGANAPGGRLYLSGDLVRFRTTQNLEFLGRIDHQVKIRGHRMEPGEVETLLRRHPDVQDAHVMLREDHGQSRLSAYVVPTMQKAPTYGGRPRYRLPNNLTVVHLNANETNFLYREMFEEIAYFKHGITVAEGQTIFDVGSNIGLFTVSTHFRAPNLRFFCFEPGPEVNDVVTANVALHDINATVFRFGLSAQETTATYTYYPEFAHLSGFYADKTDELDVVKSFVTRQEGEVEQGQDGLLEELITHKLEGELREIRLRRLSDVVAEQNVDRIDLLKINVEKAEWDVFMGIDDRHWPIIQQIAVEIHDIENRLNKITQLLKSKGFHVFVEQDWSLDEQATTNYYLYARRGTGAPAPEPVVPDTAPFLNADELRQCLSTALPEYMIPGSFVFLEHMPLNANGKVDRNALPAPGGEKGIRINPETETEALIQGVWDGVLHTTETSVTTDFFELGGHSLLAVNVMARLREIFDVDLPIRAIFEAPTIAALSRVVDQTLADGVCTRQTAIPLLDRTKPVPLSFGQQRIWFLHQMEEHKSGYNLPVSLKFKGPLNTAALEQSLTALVARHESLRTTFPTKDGAASQYIAPPGPVRVELLDMPGLEEQACNTYLREKSSQPFDLAEGPLFRVTLLQVSPEQHYLLLAQHHIISDGWSVGVLVRELSQLYKAYSENNPVDLPELPLQYADYAAWERSWLSGKRLEEKLKFWREFLAESPELLELPTDRPRPQLQTYHGKTLSFNLSQAQVHAVQSLTRELGVTPFMFYLTVFGVLLTRYSGQRRFNLGTPVANRSRRETENLIGLFLNSLVLPMNLSNDPSFRDLSAEIRRTALAAFGHADVPFEQVVEAVKPKRALSYSPLFQVMFTLQNAPMDAVDLQGLTMAPVNVNQDSAKFDLTLVMYERHGTMYGLFEYNTDLFNTHTVERMQTALLHLLDEITTDVDGAVSSYDLLDAEEKTRVLHTWNATDTAYNRDATIHQLFQRQAAATPDRIALVFNRRRLTYAALDELSDTLADRLAEAGVAPGHRVGMHAHRCVEMLAGMLGVLKLGAAYVPLDPTYPPERTAYILEDAAVSCVLTHAWYAPRFTQPVVLLESAHTPAPNERRAAEPDSAAYMIYTSGSTGRPKGVVVSHRNAVNFFTAMDQRVGGGNEAIWLAVTSISFDISVLELWWTLARGDRIVLQADRPQGDEAPHPQTTKPIDFSLFYFAADEQSQSGSNKYRLLMDGARFADQHGFSALWMPERHFHAFGGTFPNPSVAASAVAAVTKKVAIRSGSVVLPLHDPIRVAEEWSMVDNMSDGRVGLSIASGWQPNDFVLVPDNFKERHRLMREGIETLHHLWGGDAVSRINGVGKTIEVKVYPKPVQKTLPIWITAAGHPDTFRYAGEIGANILTHLLGQDLNQLSEKIALYREAWDKAGHQEKSHVTLMIHTFITEDVDRARRLVEAPFKNYLRSSINLVKTMLQAEDLDLDSEENRELLVQRAYERFAETHALFGTPESCLKLVNDLKGRDIDELACLIDFGVADLDALAGLHQLARLKQLANPDPKVHPPELPFEDPAVVMAREGVTHLQCTPSMARMLLDDERPILDGLKQLLVGGEALPDDLAKALTAKGIPAIYNMYGPTETTVWSAVAEVTDEAVDIGRPVANTRVYVLDHHMQPVPTGVIGRLWIGGDGVTQGYWMRPKLTAERFIPHPYGTEGSRLYDSGDLARFLPDGRLDYRGRVDHQIKLSGFRIEPGEIEACLNSQPGVSESVVTVRTDTHADGRLVAYVVPQDKQALTKARPIDFQSKYPRYRLPNGLEVHHHDSRQLGALYQELFADAIYLRHGLTLEPGDTIFDVGANIGGFSMFANHTAPGVKVYAFEPIPPTFELLCDNLTWNGVDVTPFNIGLSDQEEQATFTYYPHMSGLSSRFGDQEEDVLLARSLIEEQMQKGTLGEGIERAAEAEIDELLRESYTSEAHHCTLKTLSQIIREHGVETIDFLKVDVEKSECYVLRGIEDEHWPMIRQISLEVDGEENLAEVTGTLKARGYEIKVDDFITVGNAVEGRALMVYMVYAYRPDAPKRVHQNRPIPMNAETLKAAVARYVPDYMVPTDVVFLENMPLTPNGKVDKAALPAPNQNMPGDQADHVEPRNQVEKHIADIWKKILKVERVGIQDNFFELGGNSLLLTHVLSQLRSTHGAEISVVALFKYPTISLLAEHLAQQGEQTKPDLAKEKARAEQRTTDRRRLAQRRGRKTRN